MARCECAWRYNRNMRLGWCQLRSDGRGSIDRHPTAQGRARLAAGPLPGAHAAGRAVQAARRRCPAARAAGSAVSPPQGGP